MTSASSPAKSLDTIAFDTTAYSHLVRGHCMVADLLRSAKTVIMPQPVVAELKSGFEFGNRQKENETQLARFLTSVKVSFVCPSELTTEYYVALFAYARRRGRKLSHNDLWIAALAAEHSAELLTFDHDFDGLAGFHDLQFQVFDS